MKCGCLELDHRSDSERLESDGVLGRACSLMTFLSTNLGNICFLPPSHFLLQFSLPVEGLSLSVSHVVNHCYILHPSSFIFLESSTAA